MVPIQTEGFDSAGVTLTPPTGADFPARAQAILSGYATPVLNLQPYLAIVANHDPRTVVAYTVAWTVTRRNDSTEVEYTRFQFPDAVAGVGNGWNVLQGREIKTGEERLVGMGFEVWPAEYIDSYRDFGEQAAARLGEVKHLRIALDAVIFDDGALLGPDESCLAEHFIAFVRAKQAWYREAVVGLELGGMKEDVFAPMRAAVTEPFQPNPMDPLAIYTRQSAAEVLACHNRVVLEVFRRALRHQPFSIKRNPGGF
jgi:hypothetical protein